MKIIKEGIRPDATMRGSCPVCECVFECEFSETVAVACSPHVERCPSCNHGYYIPVHEVTRLAAQVRAMCGESTKPVSGGGAQ